VLGRVEYDTKTQSREEFQTRQTHNGSLTDAPCTKQELKTLPKEMQCNMHY